MRFLYRIKPLDLDFQVLEEQRKMHGVAKVPNQTLLQAFAGKILRFLREY
jgi:hypothetical protein